MSKASTECTLCLITPVLLLLFLALPTHASNLPTPPTLQTLPTEILVEIATRLDWTSYLAFSQTALFFATICRSTLRPDKTLRDRCRETCKRALALFDRLNKPLTTVRILENSMHPLYWLGMTWSLISKLENWAFKPHRVYHPKPDAELQVSIHPTFALYQAFMSNRTMGRSEHARDFLQAACKLLESDTALSQLFAESGIRLNLHDATGQAATSWLYDALVFEFFGSVDFEERISRMEAIVKELPDGVDSFAQPILWSYIRPDRISLHPLFPDEPTTKTPYPTPPLPTLLAHCTALTRKFGRVRYTWWGLTTTGQPSIHLGVPTLLRLIYDITLALLIFTIAKVLPRLLLHITTMYALGRLTGVPPFPLLWPTPTGGHKAGGWNDSAVMGKAIYPLFIAHDIWLLVWCLTLTRQVVAICVLALLRRKEGRLEEFGRELNRLGVLEDWEERES
ncbi:hypothetical protein HDV00_010507 [Rhizophlyctis rosea]|nr:hypothetical protein HDV00_010507 [Rhizophlyctis rosea]